MLFLEGTSHGALVFALLDVLALVVFLLASGNANYYLGQPFFRNEKLEGDYGVASFLAALVETTYLALSEQELAVAARGVIVVRAVEVFGNIHVFDPHLASVDDAIGIGQRGLSLTYRLDLSARQHYAGRKRLGDSVVKSSSTILYVNVLGLHSFNKRDKVKY